MRKKSGTECGFSLLELLVVLGIIALLAGLSVPAFNRTLRASNLNTGGRLLVDQLNQARQMARSRSQPIEVRLYKLPDYGRPPTEAVTATNGVYRGFQIFLMEDNGMPTAMAQPALFRDPVMISAGETESALLQDAADSSSPHYEQTPAATDPVVGVYGRNYRYVPFRFTPGGSTNLSSERNFVTLILQNTKSPAEGGDFFTVQIDPVSGGIRSFRR